MSTKRGEQDEAGQSDSIQIPVAFGATRAVENGVRAAAEAVKGKGDEEKLSVFWRVFGGTILSIAALVAVTLYNNINSTLSDLRSAVDRANEARMAADNDLRAEHAKAAEARADLVRKDEVQTRVTNIYERIQNLQNQNNTQNATLTSVKTEIDGLKERVNRSGVDVDTAKKDMASALDVLRKEQCATTDALKKDIAAMEAMKERLVVLAADVKTARDDFQKLQKDVDKNQAYDFERRDRREAQFKQLDETIKEMQKAMQECREKVARLDAIASQPAPAPVTPASGTTPVPTLQKKAPKAETAPTPKIVVSEEELIDVKPGTLPAPKE